MPGSQRSPSCLCVCWEEECQGSFPGTRPDGAETLTFVSLPLTVLFGGGELFQAGQVQVAGGIIIFELCRIPAGAGTVKQHETPASQVAPHKWPSDHLLRLLQELWGRHGLYQHGLGAVLAWHMPVSFSLFYNIGNFPA